jgi:hypothetical protein
MLLYWYTALTIVGFFADSAMTNSQAPPRRQAAHTRGIKRTVKEVPGVRPLSQAARLLDVTMISFACST